VGPPSDGYPMPSRARPPQGADAASTFAFIRLARGRVLITFLAPGIRRSVANLAAGILRRPISGRSARSWAGREDKHKTIISMTLGLSSRRDRHGTRFFLRHIAHPTFGWNELLRGVNFLVADGLFGHHANSAHHGKRLALRGTPPASACAWCCSVWRTCRAYWVTLLRSSGHRTRSVSRPRRAVIHRAEGFHRD